MREDAFPDIAAARASIHPLTYTLRILSCVAALAWVIFISTSQQVSNDFWLQAKIGEIVVRSHHIPDTLLFPFTPIRDAAFNAHEWLPSVFFNLLLAHLGEPLLPLINGLLGALLFWLTARMVYRCSARRLDLALALSLLALTMENYRHVLRPELLSLVLFVLCLDCLGSMQMHFSVLKAALFGILTMLWANVHGSFFLSPMMAAAFALGGWLDQRLKPAQPIATTPKMYWALALAAGLCSLANPAGLNLWKFVVEFSQTSLAKQEIIEWMPTFDPRLYPIRGTWIGLVGMGLTLCWMWMRRSALSHVGVVLVLLFGVLACSASRFLVYPGFVAAYVIASTPGKRPSSTIKPLAWVLVLVAMLMGLVWRYGNANGLYPYSNPDPSKLTPAMVQVLEDPQLQGNVLVSYGLGAELVYRSYPRLRPSIDSRLDSYGDAYYYMHESLWTNPVNMQKFIQDYDVRYVLIDQTDFAASKESGSLNLQQWGVLLMDYKAVLLERIH